MKRRLAFLGCLAFSLLAATGRSESEYDVRARRIADQLAPAYRESPAGDLPAPPAEGKEIVYADATPAFPAFDFGAVRFAVGTRLLHIELLDDTQGSQNQGSFIGSLYKIEANQDYLPLNPYVQATTMAGPVELGLGLSYSHLDVATVDSGGGDGDIEMDGWMLYLLAAHPNDSRFTPFGEIGLALYQNSFDPISSWSEGGLRAFALDDSQALYLGGGCDVRIWNNLSANVYLRYVDVDVDGKYYYRNDSRAYHPKPFTFTLEHLACGVGVKYVF